MRGRGRQKRSFISAKFSWRIMARIQCTDANSRSCAECGAPFDYLDCTWPRSLYRRRRSAHPGLGDQSPEQDGPWRRAKRGRETTSGIASPQEKGSSPGGTEERRNEGTTKQSANRVHDGPIKYMGPGSL